MSRVSVGLQSDNPGLEPLAYHRQVVAYLKAAEPAVWAWASSLGVQEQHARELRADLLRETYRLTPDSHGPVYAACETVMARLGLSAETTLYQAGDGAMNAQLRFLPGEAHVVFHGPVLERLDEGELAALLGHELSHYGLWSADGGDFHTAARILDHTLADPGASPSHIETARLYSLHTELFADRGGALAAGEAGPAISTLVKVQTGLASVDPAAYLGQAGELEAADASVSQAYSHPEIYLRAQAIDKWWRRDPDLEAWLRRRLHGPLSLDRFDLSDQQALTALTRRFIARFLADEELQSDTVLTQVRAYFPDWTAAEPAAADDELTPERIDDSVRGYLNYVMLDLAIADPDTRDHALARALRQAQAMGGKDAFLAALKADAGLPKSEITSLSRGLGKGGAR
ncbi:M48 family metalloprotease [Caulobacter sp. NIBR1757]|uniref:M48 family metalloprotease n=1 Tax=Caulobacter sp. NIBR1757 TaxID=3016000 RepID=UPI0022F12D24|nr:M48 family metalloprotease [Caulobacter sp. NIBR1757]WGM37496.1 hypothetical protein AMEJIAPC_00394 [Caulobacter sp. NIBR1757]